MAASDPTISDWKKINEEFQSKLNRIKTAYDNLESRMESYQLDMSERERAIIELQLDNDGIKNHNEILLKNVSKYEATILQFKERNTDLQFQLNTKLIQTQMQGKHLNKCEQAITELKLDNSVLKGHNEELSKKISDYEVLISQLKESNTRLNIRSRLNSSIAVEDQELKKRKNVFQWTLQNRGCKEAWLIAKLFKRQGFSNAWIHAEGYKKCQNCCAKKKENQCIILRN